MSWFDNLRPASFRGVPFFTFGGEIRVGRRNVLHQYPFRDEIWVEDIGRAARRITLTGFIHGADVQAQRERLMKMVELPGNGTLIHPTLGRKKVNCLDTVFTEHWDRGLMFEIAFTFVEISVGQVNTLPANATSTTAATLAAAANADAACAASFVTRAETALASGAAAVSVAVNSAEKWTRTAVGLVNTATNLYKTVTSLPGQFGRFFHGKTQGISGFAQNTAAVGGSVESLIAQGSLGRTQIGLAANALNSNAAGLSL